MRDCGKPLEFTEYLEQLCSAGERHFVNKKTHTFIHEALKTSWSGEFAASGGF